ncbi:MAG: hypothetical protein ACLU30_17350 [Odoribacter splanchnicus]
MPFGTCPSGHTFDLLFRYLKYLGYKVRYVRNITDVGHLTDDSDEGEDKIEKKAKLDGWNRWKSFSFIPTATITIEQLNTLPPSIEPHASAISSSRKNW